MQAGSGRGVLLDGNTGKGLLLLCLSVRTDNSDEALGPPVICSLKSLQIRSSQGSVGSLRWVDRCRQRCGEGINRSVPSLLRNPVH